jgi:hypothetical protein
MEILHTPKIAKNFFLLIPSFLEQIRQNDNQATERK